LKNAMQHMPIGRSAPTIVSHVDNAAWYLSVADRGPGVAPEHLSRLTEPFYRADPSRQRASGGVGLGLYLSRVIAEAHGGRLEVTSETGKGTKVQVVVPISVEG
ncbi:MAG: sensor histidine kinase, partial [Chromatiaceae bacterium]